MIKKAMFALLALSVIVTSCSGDDDSNGNSSPDPVAGTLVGGPFTFCVDGETDNVSGISVNGTISGTNSTYIVTDSAGVILGLPGTIPDLEAVDFDPAGLGTCLIWYLRYNGQIQGLSVTLNANDLVGSFDLSNSIEVVRNDPEAGMITGGTNNTFTFTVDGTPDFVSGIILDTTATGTNSTWVITDDALNILGLPPTLADVEAEDFDAAGAGTCLIWYLRYEDGLQGATISENAGDLVGCFDLSNSITVIRN